VTRKAAGADVWLFANNALPNPPVVAFIDDINDIVFLEVPTQSIDDLDASVYEPGSRWPPRQLTTDDVVIICGLPGFLRAESGEK
jgi:hypothetical protein